MVGSIRWEADVYAKGKQLNHWPHSDVVSAVMRETAKSTRRDLSVLEIGCGAGNNIWFLLEAGFGASGIDISPTAVHYARKRLGTLGFNEVDLRVGDLLNLPWDDNLFDIVVDRGALTQNTYEGICVALDEVHRVLKPEGKLFSFTLYGKQHSDRRFGVEVTTNTYDHFTGGYFANVGLTSFFEETDIRRVFSKFSDLTIIRQVSEFCGEGRVEEAFCVSGVKKKDG